MIRAFLALPLPEATRGELATLQRRLGLLRPVAPENLHLTLVFLGSHPEPVLQEAHEALEALGGRAFTLGLRGVGLFGGAAPRAVYAGVAACPALEALQARAAQAVRRAGIMLPRRRFVPHVTLARFAAGAGPDPAGLEALAEAALWQAVPFEAREMVLYASYLRPSGAVYDPLASYPLG